MLEGLERADGSAEGGAIASIVDRGGQRSPRDPERGCGRVEPFPVQGGDHLAEPGVRFPEYGLTVEGDIVEDDFAGVEAVDSDGAETADREAPAVERYHEGGDTVDGRRLGRSGTGQHDRMPRSSGAGDPGLRPIDDPTLLGAPGPGAHGPGDIGAAVGFGERERDTLTPLHQRREQGPALLVGAERAEQPHAHVLHHEADSHRRRAGGELLEHHDLVLRIGVATGARVRAQPDQPSLGQGGVELLVEPLRLVELAHAVRAGDVLYKRPGEPPDVGLVR